METAGVWGETLASLLFQDTYFFALDPQPFQKKSCPLEETQGLVI